MVEKKLLQETWLNSSIEDHPIANYSCISRFDRQDGRQGGGIAIYAKVSFSNLVHVSNSASAERSWHYLHTDLGIIAICNMYKPPDAGMDTISSLRTELHAHSEYCHGYIVMGDFNIHHRKWLRYSNANTALGEELQNICQEFALNQLIRQPTRGPHLLDLALTNMESIKSSVLPILADHNALFLSLRAQVPVANFIERTGWIYKHADSQGLRTSLRHYDWSFCAKSALR